MLVFVTCMIIYSIQTVMGLKTILIGIQGMLFNETVKFYFYI